MSRTSLLKGPKTSIGNRLLFVFDNEDLVVFFHLANSKLVVQHIRCATIRG